MFIITGLGRCGTSILTKFLGELGYALGKNVHWHPEARAGLELSPAYSLNIDMYRQFCQKGIPINIDSKPSGEYWKGHTYRSAINSIDNDDRQGGVDVFKDPRFTWDGGLIAAWWEARKDIKLIICHRLIQNIYNSRKNLPPQYDDPKRTNIEEYYEDFGRFMDMVYNLKIPHIMLHYPKWIYDCDNTWVKLNEFGLGFKFCDAVEVHDRIIDYDLLTD